MRWSISLVSLTFNVVAATISLEVAVKSVRQVLPTPRIRPCPLDTAPIRYLNLPDQIERRVQTEFHLQGCRPGQVSRIEAILGRDPQQVHQFVSLEVLTNTSRKAIGKRTRVNRKDPLQLEMARFKEHARLHIAGVGEAALTFGNARAVAQMYGEGADIGLVIEDDSVFHISDLHATQSLEYLLRNQAEEEWEVIQLFGTEMPETWAREVRNSSYPLYTDKIFHKGSISGTPSIVFNRDGMAKFLDAIAIVDPKYRRDNDDLRSTSELIEEIGRERSSELNDLVMSLRFRCPNRVRCVADWIIKAMDLKRTFIPFAAVRFMEGSTQVRDEDTKSSTSSTQPVEHSQKWLVHHRLAAKNVNLALLHLETSHYFQILKDNIVAEFDNERVMIYWDVDRASEVYGARFLDVDPLAAVPTAFPDPKLISPEVALAAEFQEMAAAANPLMDKKEQNQGLNSQNDAKGDAAPAVAAAAAAAAAANHLVDDKKLDNKNEDAPAVAEAVPWKADQPIVARQMQIQGPNIWTYHV